MDTSFKIFQEITVAHGYSPITRVVKAGGTEVPGHLWLSKALSLGGGLFPRFESLQVYFASDL